MNHGGKSIVRSAAWLAALAALLLAGCATQTVRCDGKLEPINPVHKPAVERKTR